MSGIARISGGRKTQILSAVAVKCQQNPHPARRKIAPDRH
jgi:hypothetical protein